MLSSAVLPDSDVIELASITPDVWPSRVLRTDALNELSERVIVSLLSPVMPDEVYAAMSSALLPLRDVMDEASMSPVVLPSSVLRTAAARDVSESVTVWLPSPLIPSEL